MRKLFYNAKQDFQLLQTDLNRFTLRKDAGTFQSPSLGISSCWKCRRSSDVTALNAGSIPQGQYEMFIDLKCVNQVHLNNPSVTLVFSQELSFLLNSLQCPLYNPEIKSFPNEKPFLSFFWLQTFLYFTVDYHWISLTFDSSPGGVRKDLHFRDLTLHN